MVDEFALHRAAAEAAHAQQLLDDELLKTSFKTLEDSYQAAWRGTMIEDVGAREKLFLAINILGKVRDHLTAVVSNGKLAARELRDLAETAERKKAWPDVR